LDDPDGQDEEEKEPKDGD
jgi:hypothetical protein